MERVDLCGGLCVSLCVSVYERESDRPCFSGPFGQCAKKKKNNNNNKKKNNPRRSPNAWAVF